MRRLSWRRGVSSTRPLPPCACYEVVRESHLRASPCPVPPPARPAPGARQSVKGGPLVLRDGNPCGCLYVFLSRANASCFAVSMPYSVPIFTFENRPHGTPTDVERNSAKNAQHISGVGGVCGRPLAKTPFHLTAELRVGRWCGTLSTP